MVIKNAPEHWQEIVDLMKRHFPGGGREILEVPDANVPNGSSRIEGGSGGGREPD